jgi:hypothetical protein
LFTPLAITDPVAARRGISMTSYFAGADEDDVGVVGSEGGEELDGAGDDPVDGGGLDEEGGMAGAAGLGFDDDDGSAAGIVEADDGEALGAADESDELPEPPPHDAQSAAAAAARIMAADRIAAPPSPVSTS